MAAAKGNRNAQKWTESRVLGYLSKIEEATKDKKILFLGQELVKLGLYKDIWRYWKNKYSYNEDIIEQMELIEGMFECNLFKAAINSEIPARIAIICLRNAHQWREYRPEPVKVVPMQQENRKLPDRAKKETEMRVA